MAKLTNIKNLGRYKNNETGKEYNLKTGHRSERGTDVIFYLVSFERNFISDKDFYEKYTKMT